MVCFSKIWAFWLNDPLAAGLQEKIWAYAICANKKSGESSWFILFIFFLEGKPHA